MSSPDPASSLHISARGEGHRVVLVHGFTQTGASFEPVAQILETNHAVILPDLPGHGDSPAPTGGLEGAARALGEACGPAGYVGYSLGGRVCLHLALDAPETVERLVLVSATAGIEDAYEREARVADDEALADRIEDQGEDGLASFIDEWLEKPLFETLSEEAADKKSRLRNTAAGLAAALRHLGTGTQLPLWERLGELTMPVLVVAGALDLRYVDHAERMAAAIGSNALIVIVPEAGHSVPFEQPEAFASLLTEFLDGATPVG